MPFLIDASTFIVLKNRDFPVQGSQDFWQWLEQRCLDGSVRIPEEVKREIVKGDDDLSVWMRRLAGDSIIAPRTGAPFLSRVLDAYANPMPTQALGVLQSKADPYIIAHAMALGGTVVTDEKSAVAIENPAKKKIPDICMALGVPCSHITRLIWDHRETLPSVE